MPHRVHTSRVYPLPSPNGSIIVIYGHEHGLRVLWRGGRPFKQPLQPQERSLKTNGTSSDEIIILDSDDEQQAAISVEPYTDDPVFEDEEDEQDASGPDDPIVQELDLPLGVEVLHISFPNLPLERHHTAFEALPSLLSTCVIIATVCSDSSIRIISIPITPPSPQSLARPELRTRMTISHAGIGLFGERMVIIPSAASHRSIPKGISITLTSQMLRSVEDVVLADVDRGTTSTHRSRSAPARGGYSWEFLVASHSDDLSGILLIHKIPIVGGALGNGSGPHELACPWRVQYLTSPAKSISFNPSLFPAQRHSHLIIAESRGALRIFDCQPQSDSHQGSWLFSIYPSFHTSTDHITRRKQVLDARWVLGGRAIIVLLVDGEWGVWDLENAGPKVNGQMEGAPLGGSSLDFAISGWVGSSAVSRNLVKSTGGRKDNQSRLAPMTPGTRKMRQEALFSGSTTTSSPQADGPSRGGLFVSALPSSSNSKLDDECLLLRYRDSVTVIPSLCTYWQNKVKGSGNLFGAGAKGQPKEYNNIDLGGEIRNDVSLFPEHHHKTAPTEHVSLSNKVLVTGEHRLIVIAPFLKPSNSATAAPRQILSKPADQHLLARGEPDVDGMDRMLSEMPNGHRVDHRNGATPNSKVGFLPL